MRALLGSGRLLAGLGILLALWLGGAGQPALAHDVPPSRLMLDIGARVIGAELQLPLSELGAALELPLAARPDDAVPVHGARIQQYVADHLQLHGRDARGARQAFALHIDRLERRSTANVNWTSNEWLVVHARFLAPEGVSTAVFTIDDTMIVHRVLSHQTLIYGRRDLRNGLLGDQPALIATAGFGSTHTEVDGAGGSWWQGLARLSAMGAHHIAEGTDHMLFLLVLLLSAPLQARAGRWYGCNPLGASLWRTLGIVTGFTLGHSLSLVLAATQVLAVPVQPVEVLVAVSILVSCAHVWRPLLPGRELWIASAFGLVHGLAFAEALAGLAFDGTTLALSLLGFNLGVEAMQLLVVAVALPLLLALSRAGGARAYQAVARTLASLAALCALGWVLERAFGLANPLQPVAAWLAPPPAWFAGALALASFGLVLHAFGVAAGLWRGWPVRHRGVGSA